MPRPKRVLNAFTAREVNEITGLSRPMIDYLLRMDFLHPCYADGAPRRRDFAWRAQQYRGAILDQ